MSDVDPENVNPIVGQEWIYRLRDSAPSERVRIVSVPESKKNQRVGIQFVDGERVGTMEQSPARRLRAPWSEVRIFDELMANWERIDQFDLTETEEFAAMEAFGMLVPEDVAEWEWNPVRYAVRINDVHRLEAIIGLTHDELLHHLDWFLLGGQILASREATLRIAELACKRAPTVILDWVIEEERKLRLLTKRGGTLGLSNKDRDRRTSPEWEWHWYLEHHRPKHELLRQWCGHRAITFHERLLAAEAQVQRLDVVVARLIDELKVAETTDVRFAERMEEEIEKERITPANIRPVVDRPLDFSEIPVRYERTRRRWG